MIWKALAAVGLATALLGAGSDNADLRASLHAAAVAYNARILAMAKVVGSDSALDYLQRLNDDSDLLGSDVVPQGFSQAQWRDYVRQIATLDLNLADQLLSGKYQPMASIRGLGDTFIRSSKDGTMQPVGVYVPPKYVAGHGAPLVVFLHGHDQSESQLIAPGFLASLADRTGSIVIAPYGRGNYDFSGSTSDIYDAVDAANEAFSIDPRKRFLAGYSMGGFTVFKVAPVRPNYWAGVMCVAGSLLGHDSREIVTMMHGTPFYVLTGSKDATIPTQYPTATAQFLLGSGVPVSFYSQTGGTHRLVTLLPILSQAWDDMHGGVVRTPPPMLGGAALPSSPSGVGLKP